MPEAITRRSSNCVHRHPVQIIGSRRRSRDYIFHGPNIVEVDVGRSMLPAKHDHLIGRSIIDGRRLRPSPGAISIPFLRGSGKRGKHHQRQEEGSRSKKRIGPGHVCAPNRHSKGCAQGYAMSMLRTPTLRTRCSETQGRPSRGKLQLYLCLRSIGLARISVKMQIPSS